MSRGPPSGITFPGGNIRYRARAWHEKFPSSRCRESAKEKNKWIETRYPRETSDRGDRAGARWPRPKNHLSLGQPPSFPFSEGPRLILIVYRFRRLILPCTAAPFLVHFVPSRFRDAPRSRPSRDTSASKCVRSDLSMKNGGPIPLEAIGTPDCRTCARLWSNGIVRQPFATIFCLLFCFTILFVGRCRLEESWAFGWLGRG